jgi:hypothetical protein
MLKCRFNLLLRDAPLSNNLLKTDGTTIISSSFKPLVNYEDNAVIMWEIHLEATRRL